MQGGWQLYHINNIIMMQNHMRLSNHNNAHATIFEWAIAIVIAMTVFGLTWFILENKIKECILTVIIGFSLSAWLVSLNEVSSSANC